MNPTEGSTHEQRLLCGDCGDRVLLEDPSGAPVCVVCGSPRHLHCYEPMERKACKACTVRAQAAADRVDEILAGWEASGEPVEALPRDVFTLFVVRAFIGVVGNGGFYFFFERDWPRELSYEVFARELRAIGANDVAGLLSQAAQHFPFPDAHLQADSRLVVLESEPVESSLKALTKSALARWPQTAEKLAQFVEGRRFGTAPASESAGGTAPDPSPQPDEAPR